MPPDFLMFVRFRTSTTSDGCPGTGGGKTWNSSASYRRGLIPTRAAGLVDVQREKVFKGDSWTRRRSWGKMPLSRTQRPFWRVHRSTTWSEVFSLSELSRPSSGIHYQIVSTTNLETWPATDIFHVEQNAAVQVVFSSSLVVHAETMPIRGNGTLPLYTRALVSSPGEVCLESTGVHDFRAVGLCRILRPRSRASSNKSRHWISSFWISWYCFFAEPEALL